MRGIGFKNEFVVGEELLSNFSKNLIISKDLSKLVKNGRLSEGKKFLNNSEDHDFYGIQKLCSSGEKRLISR